MNNKHFTYKGCAVDLHNGTIYHSIDGKPFYYMYVPKIRYLAEQYIDENIDVIKKRYSYDYHKTCPFLCCETPMPK